MSKPKPKNHHFVPQVLLKQFCNPDTPENLYFYNSRINKDIEWRNVESIFCKRKLYRSFREFNRKTKKLDKENIGLEDYFSTIENAVGPVLKKFINIVLDEERLPSFSTGADSLLKLFTYYQTRRTPDVLWSIERPGYFEQNFQKTTNSLISDNPDIVHTEGFKKLQDLDEQRVLFSQSRIKAIATQDSVFFRMLQSKTLSVAIASGKTSFIVGSSPVLLYTPSTEFDEADPYIQYFLPVHSKVVLIYRDSRLNSEIFHWSTKTVRQFNKAIASKSSMIASSEQALVQSLTSMVDRTRLLTMEKLKSADLS